MSENLAALLYLVSAICFIMSLRGLSSPETSRQGNLFGIVGMAIAVVTTLATPSMGGFIILAALLISTLLWTNLHNRYVWVLILATSGFAGIGFGECRGVIQPARTETAS